MYITIILPCLLYLLASILPVSTSPLASPSASQSSTGALPTLDVANSKPPKRPLCPEDFAPRSPRTRLFARQCAQAIEMIPRDTRPYSPARNFYLSPQDMSPTMPNVELPYEKEYARSDPEARVRSSFPKHLAQ
ncbi:MAG: hypothetical protein Q9170_002013, partial [Blastenia crenularia]